MRRTWISSGGLLLLGILVVMLSTQAQAHVHPEVDQALKPYQSNGSPKLQETVRAGASDTIKRLFDLWTEGFRYHHKKVTFETVLVETADAAKAIFKGVEPIPQGADLVAISFPLSQDDLQAIKAQRGVMPVQVAVAYDAIVVVAHHRNPTQGLTLQQVAAIFSNQADQSGAIEQWNQVGVDGKFGSLEVNRYGRDEKSGTYMAFKAMALQGKEQQAHVFKEPGSMSVVIEVGADERGIGYSAIGHAARSKKVRLVPIARKSGERFVLPTNETVLSGEYPISRELYIYAMPEADGSLRPALKQFIRFVLSHDGQDLVKEDGFFPLPARIVEQAMRNLEGNGGSSSAVAERKAQ